MFDMQLVTNQFWMYGRELRVYYYVYFQYLYV